MQAAILDPTPLLARRVATLLPRFSYRYASEVQLHEALATVLTDAGIPHQREVVAGPRDRFDFLVEPGLVLEVKVRGSLAEALGQCNRYAARPDVAAVLLVTSRPWSAPSDAHHSNGWSLHGKPVHLVRIRGASF